MRYYRSRRRNIIMLKHQFSNAIYETKLNLKNDNPKTPTTMPTAMSSHGKYIRAWIDSLGIEAPDMHVDCHDAELIANLGSLLLCSILLSELKLVRNIVSY